MVRSCAGVRAGVVSEQRDLGLSAFRGGHVGRSWLFLTWRRKRYTAIMTNMKSAATVNAIAKYPNPAARRTRSPGDLSASDPWARETHLGRHVRGILSAVGPDAAAPQGESGRKKLSCDYSKRRIPSGSCIRVPMVHWHIVFKRRFAGGLTAWHARIR